MRTVHLFALVAVLAVLAFGATTAHATDIYGLSFRPTETLGDAPRGTVDIVADGDGYLVSVDLSEARDALMLDDYDAEAFVVWYVDMIGKSHRVGTLDDSLSIADGAVDHIVAKVYLTAEADADVDAPTGDRLYELTLRNILEEGEERVVEEEAADTDEGSATDEDATTDEESDEDADDNGGKPSELPPTGGQVRDLLMLVLVSATLLVGALRLRGVRV